MPVSWESQQASPSALETMRERGGTWAAYQNHDLGHPDLGHLKFLRYGEGCTFATPPLPRLPDTRTEINWRYWFVGLVDLETGNIKRPPPCFWPRDWPKEAEESP